MTPLLSPKTSGKRPGKQIRKGLGLRGSKRVRDADKSCSGFARSLEAAGYDSFGAVTHAESGRAPATTCFLLLPPCFPRFPRPRRGSKKRPRRTVLSH